MAIRYDDLLALTETGVPSSYTQAHSMLYALSIGLGRDPLNDRELPFVFEGRGLRAVPTMATVRSGGSLVSRMGLNMTMLLHGEQRLTMHRPMPAAASLESDFRVVDAVDKGKGKGAIIYTEIVLREKGDDEPLATLGGSLFARGDGGFGGPERLALEAHRLPDRQPDVREVFSVRPDQALLYRLNGDLNPLHADPALATRAGFAMPILHGLCGYGNACRAVLATVCDYDPARIASFDVRFSSPVFPGEEITTEIWVDGDIVSFRCLVEARGVTSINNGRCVLQPIG